MISQNLNNYNHLSDVLFNKIFSSREYLPSSFESPMISNADYNLTTDKNVQLNSLLMEHKMSLLQK